MEGAFALLYTIYCTVLYLASNLHSSFSSSVIIPPCALEYVRQAPLCRARALSRGSLHNYHEIPPVQFAASTRGKCGVRSVFLFLAGTRHLDPRLVSLRQTIDGQHTHRAVANRNKAPATGVRVTGEPWRFGARVSYLPRYLAFRLYRRTVACAVSTVGNALINPPPSDISHPATADPRQTDVGIVAKKSPSHKKGFEGEKNMRNDKS